MIVVVVEEKKKKKKKKQNLVFSPLCVTHTQTRTDLFSFVHIDIDSFSSFPQTDKEKNDPYFEYE